MAKKLIIAVFVISLAMALYVFMTRETKSLKQSINQAAGHEPRVMLEDFVAYRYEADVLKAKLAGRIGEFFEPNIVELEGEVRGERLVRRNEQETINAESATAFFNANSLTKMLDPSQSLDLERAELSGFVEVGVKEHLLTTDYAEYLNRDKIVRSQRPVRVEGPSRVFTGDSGFSYQLSSQVLEMNGHVKGEVDLENAKK